MWLRNQRNERSFNQRAFADALGVSPGFLSRVESDEKRLSPEALARAAAVLEVDPVQLQLRAGVIPANLAQKIASDPAGFLAWTARP